VACHGATDEAGRGLTDTLGRRRVGRFVVWRAKRERGVRAKSRARPAVKNPRRGKTQGSIRWPGGLTLRPAARDSRNGKPQELGPVGPAQCYGVGSNDRLDGKWGDPGGNSPETVREEKAPKGESHERCRCERKPARDSKGVSRPEGNQTLKAERSGWAYPREWTFDPSCGVGKQTP
jgi:hypothetical protein